MSNTSKAIKFKPAKFPFLFLGLIRSFIVFILLVAISILVLFLEPVIAFLIFIFALFGFIFKVFYRIVTYKKTEYEIKGDRCLFSTGGLFSSTQTELRLANATQVCFYQTILERYFFKTGTVFVKAAGSSGDEIVFFGIANPEEVYQQVQDSMEEIGFKLNQSQPVCEYQRDGLVLFLKYLVGFIFEILFLVGSVFAFIIGFFLPDGVSSLFSLVSLIFIIISGLIFASTVLKYLSDRAFRYQLYDDKVMRVRDFLSKEMTLIPHENITNSESNQSFLERIFGVYTLKISCQGAENNIYFETFREAPEFKQSLDNILKNTESQVSQNSKPKQNLAEEDSGSTTKISTKTDLASVDNSSHQRPSFQDDFQLEFKMSLFRSVFGYIASVGILTILFIIVLIISFAIDPEIASMVVGILIFFSPYLFTIFSALIKPLATTYKIGTDLVSENYSFLSKQYTEFKTEKITGMVLLQNPVDRFLKTYTIKLQSIGSNKQLVFRHISSQSGALEGLAKKLGYDLESEGELIKSKYSLVEALKANLFWYSFYILALVILLLLSLISSWFVIIAFLLAILLASYIIYAFVFYSKMNLQILDNSVKSSKGIFFRETTFAHFVHIKDSSSTQYPFSTSGNISINIAGESAGEEEGSQFKIWDFAISLSYIENIRQLHEKLDEKLSQHPFILNQSSQKLTINTDIIAEYKVSLPLDLISSIFTSIITMVAIPFLPITIPYTIAANKNKKYTLKSWRILEEKGVFYKQLTTVLYNRFDHINKNQNLVSGIFGVGNVQIFTTGTSKAELTAGGVIGYEEVYRELEGLYE